MTGVGLLWLGATDVVVPVTVVLVEVWGWVYVTVVLVEVGDGGVRMS